MTTIDFIEEYPDLLSQVACDGIIERMDHIIDHSILMASHITVGTEFTQCKSRYAKNR